MKKYLKTQANGEAIEVLANDGEGISNEAISEDTTLTAEDSGKTILLDAVGEAITLPAVANGLKFKFLLTAATITSSWTITAATAVIYGSAQLAGAVLPASAESVITIVHTKGLPGDWISLESDGTNWYVEGSVATAAGLTFTAP